MLSKEKFAEILKEYGYSDQKIEKLWDTRPTGINVELTEDIIRWAIEDHSKLKP